MSGPNENTSCEWFEASIAASLYEPLPAEEQKQLTVHLDACAACRATEADLREFVAQVPAGPIEEPVDLWPDLNRRIAPRRRFHGSLYAAAAVLFVVVGANIARLSLPQAAQPKNEVVASAVHQSIDRAKSFEANHDFTKALKELQATLAAHATDLDVGEAQLALAELEFSHGQRYAEAYDAYAALKAKYPGAWSQSPVNADRLDLLTEAKAANFQPLYDLNAAKNSGTDPFGQLERIAAKPDGCLVAALAVNAMRELVGGPGSTSGAGKVAALEKVRDRCKDPVAAAQIKMALADAHWTELHDAATARGLYGEVAKAPQPLVAQAARAALAKLEATRP